MNTEQDIQAALLPTPEQLATRERLLAKLRALYHQDQMAFHEKVLIWHDVLKSKYPNARDYMLFHLISGSTFKGFNGCFDFDPPDSVEAFIEREYRAAFPPPVEPPQAV